MRKVKMAHRVQKRRYGVRQMPSVVILKRSIPELVRLLLFVRAGGRCEFDGCNRYLMSHHLTLTAGNFGQMAHVVAFRVDGPRGGDPHRPKNINHIENLMLLCQQCHKEIDDHPKRYSRQALLADKNAHEMRIKLQTELGPNRRTAVLVFKALIGGQAVSVPVDQIIGATAPRYPSLSEPITIDVTALLSSDHSSYMRTVSDTIKSKVASLFTSEGEATKVGHLSVFALGPIPLLIYLGRQLSSKVPNDVYQRHRDTESWTWKASGKAVKYSVRRIRSGLGRKVAVILSLSGKIQLRALPANEKGSTIYEITLQGQSPNPTFLRMKKDLENFRITYQDLLGQITCAHGLLDKINLYPATPAPIAVLCGRELLPKVHPKLRVFDYDKAAGGFNFKLEV